MLKYFLLFNLLIIRADLYFLVYLNTKQSVFSSLLIACRVHLLPSEIVT